RPLTRRRDGEVLRKQRCERTVFGQLADAAMDALQRRRDEVEVPHAAAGERLLGKRAEDLERTLEKGLEIAAAHRSPFALRQLGSRRQAVHAPVRIVVDQLQLRLFAE